MRLRLTPATAQDISDARSWYDTQRPLLGDRFEEALDHTFALLLEHPQAFPVVHRRTRRAPVSASFSSYLVFYRIEGEEIVVVAVIHGARHPRTWQRRR